MNRKILGIAVVVIIAIAAVASVAFLFANGNSPFLLNQNTTPTVTITYGKGATCPAGELYVDVHIHNNGYANFQPLGSKFELTMNGVVYHYHFAGSQLLGWQNVDLANGERYDASIAFKVPDTSASFVLSYNNSSTDYNIVCRPE